MDLVPQFCFDQKVIWGLVRQYQCSKFFPFCFLNYGLIFPKNGFKNKFKLSKFEKFHFYFKHRYMIILILKVFGRGITLFWQFFKVIFLTFYIIFWIFQFYCILGNSSKLSPMPVPHPRCSNRACMHNSTPLVL